MTGLNAEVSAPPVAADQHSFSPSVGGLLINIDKGGTLTDFCVIDGENVYRTKLVALWRFHPHQCARGCHIYGPSDSTLNCQGVRICTAEIYRAVEKIPEVAVSLIVRGELPGGNFFIPLFLVLKNLAQLDEDIQLEITTKLPQYCPQAMFATECIGSGFFVYLMTVEFYLMNASRLTGQRVEDMVRLRCQTGMLPPSDTYPLLDTEIYQIFREYLQHEDGLANNRLSWMLTIHGFLYASYAFTIQTKLQVAQRMNSDSLTHSPGVDSAFLTASIWQVDSVIFLICFVGFFISLVALRSIGAAGKANETILKVFEKQFGVQPAFGAPETVLVTNKLILPTIAGGGDHQNIPKGFLSARWIPVFLMSGWVFSLLFDAWLIWYAHM